MKKHFWKIVLVVVIVLMGGSIVLAQQIGKKANEGVVIQAHTKGNQDAVVVLTEYADFQCPACGQFYPVVKEVMEEHGGELKLEFKHFPLVAIHPFALSAAKATEAAGQQGKFFEMHDMLFEKQSEWSKVATPQAFFVQYAQELGLDVDLFKKHMRASMLSDHVKGQYEEARELGLTGTPTFYLNGQKLEFKSIEDFKSKIESALGKGTSAEAVVPTGSSVQFGLPAGL